MQPKRSSSNWSQWIGVAIFLMFAFGTRFLPPLATWLTQVTGIPINVPVLMVAVLVVGAVVGGLQSLVGRMLGTGQGSETRLPTSADSALPTILRQSDVSAGLPPRPMLPPRSAPPFPGSISPSSSASQPPLGGPPKFEPIINPRVLAFGVAGLLAFGVIFLILLLMPL